MRRRGILVIGLTATLVVIGGGFLWYHRATMTSAPIVYKTAAQAPPGLTPATLRTVFPSLAYSVNHRQPVSLTTIKAAAQNPERLGTLPWSAADTRWIVQTLGSRRASAAQTQRYVLTFLYAGLSNNDSVLNGPLVDGGHRGALLLENLPHQVSQVDQVLADGVQFNGGSPDYPFTVTYTTTDGVVVTHTFWVSILKSPRYPADWVIGGVSE